MRAIWLLVAVCVGGGGAAWLLLQGEAPPAPFEAEAGDARPGVPKAEPLKGTPIDVPRIGVLSPRDQGLAADPEAGPWQARMLRFTVAPGSRLTGKDLLKAVSQHLYVRSRDQATLEAFDQLTFEVDPAHEMPLSALEPMLRRAGYAFDVKEPRSIFMVRRLKPGELEGREPKEPDPPR